MKNNETKLFLYINLGRFFGHFSNTLDVFTYLLKSAFFFSAHKIPYFNNRSDYFSFIQKYIGQKEIVFLEFGVYSGESIRWWLNNNTSGNSLFYGFDTFTGLPDDWNNNPKGTFNMDGNIPLINDKRVNFLKGLFADTLPDCSLYEQRNIKC